jgi:aminoacyl tRNA synthase complex-interacting multifunctional protein 1
MTSFLRGDPPEVTVDYRGPDVPDPPVDGLDDLLARNQKAVSGDTVDKSSSASLSVETKDPQVLEPSAEIDFSKLDVRVGVITKAWEHEESSKLFCEEIDVGEPTGPRRIASGLRAHYAVQDLVGQRVLVVCNLKARKLAGFESHGMVLCASTMTDSGTNGEEELVQFVEPPDDAVIGERVMVAGMNGAPATENQILKKKMLDVIFPALQTNGAGIATYQGLPLSTSAGPCKPTLPNANIA